MRFWEKGLRFGCTRCGACCCGAPGIVYFSPAEFDALCDFLLRTRGLDRETVERDFMRPWLDSFTARDDFEDGHCIFFENGCTVYEARPSQCRDFPFWRQNLASLDAWRRVARECPGIDRGELHGPEEILAVARRSRL